MRVACLSVLFISLAGCSNSPPAKAGGKSELKTAAETIADAKRPDSKPAPAGALVVLDASFFPMKAGNERQLAVRNYTPKKYGEPDSPLTVRTEKWNSVWIAASEAEKSHFGNDAMRESAGKEGVKKSAGALPGGMIYRKTPEGVFRCDSFGTAGGQKALYYQALDFKWGAKPGDSWKTAIEERKRTYQAKFVKTEMLGKLSCAVVLVTQIEDGKASQRRRYWLAKDVGVVRSVQLMVAGNRWRPAHERIYAEVGADLPEMEWEPD
ncbi:MAG: hypothetical protein K2X38_19120 [Gemmataceae bacterium]|nr:hypothetical protein [Gemmataceae bacterium]